MAFENTKGLLQTTIIPGLKANMGTIISVFIYYAVFIYYGLPKYGFERTVISLLIIMMVNITHAIRKRD